MFKKALRPYEQKAALLLSADAVWKSDLPVELHSAFSNYIAAAQGLMSNLSMSNLSRSCPTKWKMSKALRGEGPTRKLHKVPRVTWWHHKWVLTMIKGTLSTQETTGMEEGSKQRQSQLDNHCSSIISSKLVTEILLDQNFFDSLHSLTSVTKMWLKRQLSLTGWNMVLNFPCVACRACCKVISPQYCPCSMLVGQPARQCEIWPFIPCGDSKGHLKHPVKAAGTPTCWDNIYPAFQAFAER